ncbi:MAG: ribonuclease III [Pseudobutyrivibrio ruminis]|nr:ribonuclease III [Pseudobutyrivibrio ruminis]
MNQNLKEFQKIIGYEFRDESLLKQALTHSSYANENHMPKLSDNERLEFLGDAVLEIVSSEFLYLNYADLNEGKLSRLRASIVCEPTLAFICKEIRLGEFVLLSKGEDMTGGRDRKSILSDAFEATIGAIFLDGGMEPASEYIHRFVLNDIEHKQLFHDSKTRLQEVVQANYKEALTYNLISESGPDHAKEFKVEAVVGSRVLGVGIGRTKKAAEQEAAYEGLLRLHKEDSINII